MRHLDLFSGIGGFALATEMIWDDVEHVFCDNDLFVQAVLRKHWPNAPIYGDIRTLTANTRSHEQRGLSGVGRQEIPETWIGHQIDLLTGGFPCQPFSAAGRRRGTEDDRHLWPEMLRVIREFHPRWIIGENVGGLLTWNEGVVLEQVHTDLEGEGYEVQAFVIPAAAVNAPHRRDRVWIVGSDTKKLGRREGGAIGRGVQKRKGALGQSERRGFANEGGDVTDSSSKQMGLARQSWEEPDASDAERARYSWQEHQEGSSPRHHRGPQPTGWDENWAEVASRLCRVDDGIPRRLDRNNRLKALGNAIVPQVAAEVMRAIKAVDV